MTILDCLRNSNVFKRLVFAVVFIVLSDVPAAAQVPASDEPSDVVDNFLIYAQRPSTGLSALIKQVRDLGTAAHPYFREYMASLDLSQPHSRESQVSLHRIGQIFYLLEPVQGDASVARAIIRETMEKDISDDYRRSVFRYALDCLAKIGQAEDQDITYIGLADTNAASTAARALAAIGDEEGLAYLKAHIEKVTEGRTIVDFFTGIQPAQMTKSALDMEIRLLNLSIRRSSSDEEKIGLRDKLTDVEKRLEIWQSRYDAHYLHTPEERAAALEKLEALLAARKTVPPVPEPEIPDEAIATQIASVQEPLPIFPEEVEAIPETAEPPQDTESSPNKVFALVFIAALALLAGAAFFARVSSRK